MLREFRREALEPGTFQQGLLGGPPREPRVFAERVQAFVSGLATPVREASLVVPDAWLRTVFAEIERAAGQRPGARGRPALEAQAPGPLPGRRAAGARGGGRAAAGATGGGRTSRHSGACSSASASRASSATSSGRSAPPASRSAGSPTAASRPWARCRPGDGTSDRPRPGRRPPGTRVVFARGAEPVLHRFKSFSDALPVEARASAVARDTALDPHLPREPLPGRAARRGRARRRRRARPATGPSGSSRGSSIRSRPRRGRRGAGARRGRRAARRRGRAGPTCSRSPARCARRCRRDPRDGQPVGPAVRQPAPRGAACRSCCGWPALCCSPATSGSTGTSSPAAATSTTQPPGGERADHGRGAAHRRARQRARLLRPRPSRTPGALPEPAHRPAPLLLEPAVRGAVRPAAPGRAPAEPDAVRGRRAVGTPTAGSVPREQASTSDGVPLQIDAQARTDEAILELVDALFADSDFERPNLSSRPGRRRAA